MKRDLQFVSRKIKDEKIKNRLDNIKVNRKLHINPKLIWSFLIFNLVYIVMLTINFLLSTVGAHNGTGTGDQISKLNYHLMFYLMPAFLNILFSILVYFSRSKISVGNFFVIFWGAIWVLGIILPFIFGDDPINAFQIIGAIVLAGNVCLLFYLYFQIYKHREMLRVSYYNKKLSNL